jgi:hypothetical protein
VKRLAAAGLATAALAVVGTGCSIGGSDSATSDSTDLRTRAFECLQVSDVDAKLEGDDWIQVGDAPNGPRIRFFLTSGEAESEQFTGNAEGAEQIGPTLLFVKGGSDEELKAIEECLANL